MTKTTQQIEQIIRKLEKQLKTKIENIFSSLILEQNFNEQLKDALADMGLIIDDLYIDDDNGCVIDLINVDTDENHSYIYSNHSIRAIY